MLKCIILAYFSIYLAIHALNFRASGRKTQIVGKYWENFWWKLYRKIAFLFYFYFGKFVTKNRAFGNNTIFLKQFFSVSGGGFPFPPGHALDSKELMQRKFEFSRQPKSYYSLAVLMLLNTSYCTKIYRGIRLRIRQSCWHTSGY